MHDYKNREDDQKARAEIIKLLASRITNPYQSSNTKIVSYAWDHEPPTKKNQAQSKESNEKATNCNYQYQKYLLLFCKN